MRFILNKMCIFSVFQSFCFYTVSQRFWTLEFLLTGNMTEMLNQPLDSQTDFYSVWVLGRNSLANLLC